MALTDTVHRRARNVYDARMTRLLTLVGLSAFVACGACGGGETGGGEEISKQGLSGRIAGKAWTFKTGEARTSVADTTQFLVSAYGASFVACTDATPFDTDKVVLALPKMPGTYAISASLSQTFSDAETKASVAATSGALVIESVTATTITGGARFTYDADNAVDGQFAATICP